MKKLSSYFSAAALFCLLAAGCAHYSTDVKALAGMSVADLQKARETGKTKTYNAGYDTVYDNILSVLSERSLKVLQQDRKKGIIVAIGFPKQTDTTRVGIFIESIGDSTTKVTLSSLSSSALAKADFMIFGSLSNEIIVN